MMTDSARWSRCARSLAGGEGRLGRHRLDAFKHPLDSLNRRRLRRSSMLIDGADEVAEERMWLVEPRLELGVELRSYEPWMVSESDDFHQIPIGRKPTNTIRSR